MGDSFDIDRLPKRVRVGPYSYQLELVAVDHVRLEGNWGITLNDDNLILVAREIPLDRMVNTVIHEIGHCINSAYGVEDGAGEEHITTQTANGWVQVYRDNPKLELWLHRAFRELRKTQ